MTTHTSAPAQQALLTDDEIRVEIHDAIGFAFAPNELQMVNGADLMNVAYALLSKLRAPVADERDAARYRVLREHTAPMRLAESMGIPRKQVKRSGDVATVVDEMCDAALASAPVAKPKRAPVDDWRVQAIAECLEAEWDYMTPDQAEADARLIVGYMIEYEKESDRIEAKHAAEPVEPIVQAIRNLRASAPVAGEAVCKTCGGSRVDPGGLPICRDCGAAPQASEAALEACRLVVKYFGPTEHDYIFSKRMAIQKCRAALSAQPGAQMNGGGDGNQ